MFCFPMKRDLVLKYNFQCLSVVAYTFRYLGELKLGYLGNIHLFPVKYSLQNFITRTSSSSHLWLFSKSTFHGLVLIRCIPNQANTITHTGSLRRSTATWAKTPQFLINHPKSSRIGQGLAGPSQQISWAGIQQGRVRLSSKSPKSVNSRLWMRTSVSKHSCWVFNISTVILHFPALPYWTLSTSEAISKHNLTRLASKQGENRICQWSSRP